MSGLSHTSVSRPHAKLVALTIKNIVLIEHLNMDWHAGLNVLTGETGAGKSILLDALGLAIGARSEARLVRHGTDHGSVTAEFSISVNHPVQTILTDQDIEMEDDHVVMRRRLGADGRSRAFINDQPVSVGTLRQIGEYLVEVHGQHDTHGLMDPKTHRGLLDAFAGLSSAPQGSEPSSLVTCRAAWDRLKTCRKAYEAAEDSVRAARAEEDYLRHVVEELTKLAPEHGEDQALAEERTLLMQSEKLAEALDQADKALNGDNGAISGLRQTERALSRLADKAGPRMAPILEQSEKAAIEVDELSHLLAEISRTLDVDPNRLEKVEERLFALKAASRKHRVEVDALPALAESYSARLKDVEDGDQKLAKLKQDLSDAIDAYGRAAGVVSDQRCDAAQRLDDALVTELAPLKMDRATFETHVQKMPEGQWGPDGWDSVEFCIAANPGSPVGPLARVASGGELSRVTLALKVVLAAGGAIGTMVFDEVDAGVGGATAAAVGERLARLASEGAQVLVVTHSPQVAARGHHHWQISKSQSDSQTATQVLTLGQTQRLDEIARMLAGSEITDSARAAAQDLLSHTI